MALRLTLERDSRSAVVVFTVDTTRLARTVGSGVDDAAVEGGSCDRGDGDADEPACR